MLLGGIIEMRKRSRWMSAIIAAALITTQVIPALADAAPDGKTVAKGDAFEEWKESVWETTKNDWTIVSLTPGSDESQMNFAWYSKQGDEVTFKYGKQKDLSDAATIKVSQTETGQVDNEGIFYVSNKVVITGLEADTVYYYQVSGKNIESFTTGNTDSFTFAFVGDPQIGSSNELKAKKPENLTEEFYQVQSDSVASDSYNWSDTLNKALEKNSNINFIVSAGDQIQTNAKKVEDTTISEIEYAGYLLPKALTSLPVATTVGNHDADNANYNYHFNVPNLSTLGANDYVGGDYYFTYGNVLFMMLNTQDTNSAEHKKFIEETVAANPDCIWKIVTLHQDIYGSAEHSNEPEIVNLRYALTPVFEKCGVDVVLTGHDHAYSRSKFLYGDTETKEITYTDDEFDEMLEADIDAGDSGEQLFVAPGNIKDTTTDSDELTYLSYLKDIMDESRIKEDTNYVINPEGILYLTASSSSGSKYYDLVARTQSYIASRWQEDVPTYSLIDVTETTLTINTYRTDTNEKIDESVTIVKTTDKEALSAKIAEIKKLSETDYTAESWTVLQNALTEANKVLNDETATEEEVKAALAKLTTAYEKLVKAESKKTSENDTTTVASTDTTAANTNTTAVKTGDNSGIKIFAVVGVMAGCVICVSVYCGRKTKREQ